MLEDIAVGFFVMFVLLAFMSMQSAFIVSLVLFVGGLLWMGYISISQ